MIWTNCPQCGHKLELTDDLAGTDVRCIYCGGTTRTPEPFEMPPGVSVQAAPLPCVLCGRPVSAESAGDISGSLCPACVGGLSSTQTEPLKPVAKPLTEGEVVLLQTRTRDWRSPRSLVVPVLLFCFVPLFGVGLIGSRHDLGLAVTMLLLMTFVTTVCVAYFLSWLGYRRRRMTVTNLRTVYEHGLTWKHADEMPHATDVVASELLGAQLGGLSIAGLNRELTLVGLKDPSRPAGLINALCDNAAARADTPQTQPPTKPPPLPPRRP